MSAPSLPRAPAFASALDALQAEPGVHLALLVSPDGLLIAGASGDEVEEMWAAVSAVAANLGGKLIASVDGGAMESALFRAAHSQFVVRRVALGFVLAVAHLDADLERLCERMESAAREVETIGGALTAARPERDEDV